jgi:transcriptional antiterminator NusG
MEIQEKKMEWFIIRVAKGQDKKVKISLLEQLKRYKVTDLVADIVIPTEKEVKLKNGKKLIKSKNMLAGYVFINAALNPVLIEIISQTRGCYGFMGNDPKHPLPLRQNEISNMLGTIEDDKEVILINWIKGERIKINDGPFSGFEGQVTENDYSKNKLKVEVKIFGRSTPLELEYHSVEKIA